MSYALEVLLGNQMTLCLYEAWYGVGKELPPEPRDFTGVILLSASPP